MSIGLQAIVISGDGECLECVSDCYHYRHVQGGPQKTWHFTFVHIFANY